MRATHAQVHELAAEVTHLLDEAAADTHGHELSGKIVCPPPNTRGTWDYVIYPGKTLHLGDTPGSAYDKLDHIRETLNIVLGNY